MSDEPGAKQADPKAETAPLTSWGARESVNVDSLALRVKEDLQGPQSGPRRGALEHRFDVHETLGEGGMGEVKRGEDRGLLRQVAVKLVHAHLNWGVNQARFAREAQVNAQLEHPNIVPVYSFEESMDGDPAIVMRFVSGQTLHEYVHSCRDAGADGGDQRAPHDLSTRLAHMLKVCDAVQYAHDRGVLHRDLKPANIMLGEHNEVYVMDWGLAGVQGHADEPPRRASTAASTATTAPTVPESIPDTDADTMPADTAPESGTPSAASAEPPSGPAIASGTPDLTREGDIFGTPQYMAPEQALGEVDRMGPPSDQYALALMLYELAFLRPARPRHDGSNPFSGAAVGYMEPFEHVDGQSVPAGLIAVIQKATAQQPADRYASVGAMAEDIRLVMLGEPPSVLPETALQRLWRRLNQDPIFAMRLVLALLAIAFAATTTSLWQRMQHQQRAAVERNQIGELATELGRHGQQIEDALSQVETLVQGWARAAEQVIAHAEPTEIAWVPQEDIANSAPELKVAFSERHGQPVTHERAVFVLAPGVERESVWPTLGKLGHLNRQLSRWLGGALGRKIPLPGNLKRDELPLLWIYLALEEGALVSFPGNAGYPADYDPRKRPWYLDSKRDGEQHWRAPYADITAGRAQLPCTQALHDENGKFIGMVAIDISLRDLRPRLAMGNIPGWQESWLVDAGGRVLLQTSTELTTQQRGSYEDRGVKFEPLPIAEIAAQIKARDSGGVIEQADQILAHQRLHTLGWHLVARFDRAQLFSH